LLAENITRDWRDGRESSFAKFDIALGVLHRFSQLGNFTVILGSDSGGMLSCELGVLPF
jgi:hypothetical protein